MGYSGDHYHDHKVF